MAGDLSPKEFADRSGLSERTVRRRLALYRLVIAGKRLPSCQRSLAIAYRHRFGVPYRIPAEELARLARTEELL